MNLSPKRFLILATLALTVPGISPAQKLGENMSFEEKWETVAENQKLGVILRLERLIRPEASKIAIYFQFSKEKQEEMEALVESALDEAGDDYVKACRKMIDSLDEKRRKTAMDRGMVSNYLPGAPDYRKFDPSTRSIWKEGWKTILTEEENSIWQDRKKRLEEDQFKLLASKLIVLMESDIYLSSEQREKLVPLIGNSMKKDANLQRMQAWSSVNIRTFSQFLNNKAHAAAISAELNNVQKRQFTEWVRVINAPLQKLEATLPKRRDVESIEGYRERIIATLVQAQKGKDRGPRQRLLLGRVDYLDDKFSLTPSQRSGLELAAKGMLELLYDSHLASVESSTRRWVESVRDGNYNRYMQHQRVQQCLTTPDESLWTATTRQVLSESQVEQLESLSQERKDFEAETALATIRLKSEQILHLRKEQWEELVPHLQLAITEAVPELNQYLPAMREPWYFNSYRMFFPYYRIPENTLRGILSESQRMVWSSDIRAKLDRALLPGIEAAKDRMKAEALEKQ